MARHGRGNKLRREAATAPYNGDREPGADAAKSGGTVVRLVVDERHEPMALRGPETTMVSALVQCLTCMEAGNATQWKGRGPNDVRARGNLEQEHVDQGHPIIPNGDVYFTDPVIGRTSGPDVSRRPQGSAKPERMDLVVTASVHCLTCTGLSRPSRHQAVAADGGLATSALYQEHAEQCRVDGGESHPLKPEGDIIVSEPHMRPPRLVRP